MKHIFIINPIAGRGKNQNEIMNNINKLCKNEEIIYEIYITECKRDTEKYIIDKCEENIPYIFFACGGDGTLHEVINAAFSYKHVIIGHIPCGTGNDFVKNFSNEKSFNDIAAQIQGRSEYIDLIRVNDKYGASVCNVGLDADAAYNMHRFKRIPLISGTTCYILSVFYCLIKNLGKNLIIEFDNKDKIESEFLLGVAANGHSYGGGYKCAPRAKINDGILDVCLVKRISRLKIIGLMSSYKEGTHLENEKINGFITYKKCKKLKIKSDKTLNLCIDGENYLYNEIDIEIINNGIKFWIPKGSEIL